VDELVMNVHPQYSDFYMSLFTTLLKHDLQITRYSLLRMAYIGTGQSILFAGFPFESFVNPLLDDSELLEAILMKSGHHIRRVLNQAQDPQGLDPELVFHALVMATISGWIEGCKIMVEAGLMACLDKDHSIFNPAFLLRCSVGTNRLDMLQFWLSQREKHKSFQLGVIGSVEDMLDAFYGNTNASYNIDEIRILMDYLFSSRHDIRLLVEEHGVHYCCNNAQKYLPDAHAQCMLNALVSSGFEVPQHLWPTKKSLYYMSIRYSASKVALLDSLERVGFREITQESFECRVEKSCSPLLYLVTQEYSVTHATRPLTQRDLTVQWFLSRGTNLRETWPGSDVTALHCLAWQSAEYLGRFCEMAYGHQSYTMEEFWAYEGFEFLMKDQILDGCGCGCSSSGCSFLSCFWKELFVGNFYCVHFPSICDEFENAIEMQRTMVDNDDANPSRRRFSILLLNLTLWIDEAARSLELRHIIHEYIRSFVFSYLELRHTCCDINRIGHWGKEDPDFIRQPCPRYSPKEEKRIKNEDAHLLAVLEELVPSLISQYNSFGGNLQNFVIDVLLPTMRATAKTLKEEDKALYAFGRRELGVIMHEDEAESEQDDSNEEEEEANVEESSDDEY
jgi:hypothetical protein